MRSTARNAARFGDWAIGFGLLLAVLLVYGQTEHFDFTSYDDPEYVTQNELVRNGLTAESFAGAWKAVAVGNWIPLTVLSHIADTQWFGMEPGGRHMVNVLLDALAAILLFAALARATRARWPSAFVAAMFALHPLHVESVAWISERKDVLSAFFGFLALYAYVRYSERRSLRGYLLIAVPFALSLLAKPMLVTFPFVLLLLDFWPLERAKWPNTTSLPFAKQPLLDSRGSVASALPSREREGAHAQSLMTLCLEKLPLMALSAADCVVTYRVQGTAVQIIPLALRLKTAVVSCVIYIAQMFWPAGLAVFYPYHAVPLWQVILAGSVLAAITALAIYSWRERPYLAIGWLWFLGTLVPVIGIVQAGAQAHADRYMYIPMVGLTMMLAWGAAEVIEKRPEAKRAIGALAIGCCAVSMALTARQAAFWQDSETLFQHAIDVTRNNYVAESGLGAYLTQIGRVDDAIPHLEEFLRLVPGDAQGHNNLGILYGAMPGHEQQAIAHFEAAVRIHPDFKEAQYNLGLALSRVPGRTAEAIAHLDAARRIEPSETISRLIERLRAGQNP